MSDIKLKRLNDQIPDAEFTTGVNDNFETLRGTRVNAKFNKNQCDAIISDSGLPEKWLRDIDIGHATTNYGLWQVLQTLTNYSIWKYPVTSLHYAYDTINELYMNEKDLEKKGQASGETYGSFSSVLLWDGAAYIDDTIEAGTQGGTAFDLMLATGDALYVGLGTTFNGVDFNFSGFGSAYTLKVEYWNGSAWTQLTATADDLADNTLNFKSNGQITFTSPSDWAKSGVGDNAGYDADYYYIKITTLTRPISGKEASCWYIMPSNTVINLLSLGRTELANKDYAWCYYNGYVYVTLPNTGSRYYEGKTHIMTNSTETNKQNYFVYNNHFKVDCLNSSYVSNGIGNLRKMTNAERLVITPTESMIVLTTDTNRIYVCYTDGAWTALSGSGAEVSDNNPVSDAAAASPGVGVKASRDDHVHPYSGLVMLRNGSTEFNGTISHDDNNITKVNDIELVSVSPNGAAIDVDFNVNDNRANALEIKTSDGNFLKIDSTNASEKVTIGVNGSDELNINASGIQVSGANARIDEFSIDGTLAGNSDTALPTEKAVKAYVDGAAPAAHAASHENGGGDEISVAGLSGELADDQPPKDHATAHAPQTGGDPIICASPLDITSVDVVASEGTSDYLARADHAHGIDVGVPSNIAEANAEGSATEFCRKDHVHNHPDIASDLHTVYIKADGTRAFGGNQSFGDNNITNVGDVALDSISADGTTMDIDMTDNVASALEIKTGDGNFIKIDTTNAAELITIGENGNDRLNINASGIQMGSANARVTTVLDEDAMGSDSPTALATQQSIKKYVDDNMGGGKVALFMNPGAAVLPNSDFALIEKVSRTNCGPDYVTKFLADGGVGTDYKAYWQVAMPAFYSGGNLTITIYSLSEDTNAAHKADFHIERISIAHDEPWDPGGGYTSIGAVDINPTAAARDLLVDTIAWTSNLPTAGEMMKFYAWVDISDSDYDVGDKFCEVLYIKIEED